MSNGLSRRALFLIPALLFAAGGVHPSREFVAHEWGTFTSVADREGNPVTWYPITGPDDLPCFVRRFTFAFGKAGFPGRIRMETPVIYFYGPAALTASVQVRFPRGLITEWFPAADEVAPRLSPQESDWNSRRNLDGRIEWWTVQISANARGPFPDERRPSHYYAARATDAAPVAAGGSAEKFLFYRGVGRFDPPLTAAATEDRRLRVRTSRRISKLIAFENRDGRIGFRLFGPLDGETYVDRPAIEGGLADLRGLLEELLTEFGLYRKEAAAMVKTWEDSWFEEGTRVLYIVPRDLVDEELPLAIEPPPSAVARVFVGRVEMVTPEIVDDAARAIEKRDAGSLTRLGRFLQPILEDLRRGRPELMNPSAEGFITRCRQSTPNACGR